MGTTQQAVASRLLALADKGEEVLATHRPNPPNVIGFPTLDSGRFSEWRTQSLAFLRNVFGEGHVYPSSFADATDRGGHTGEAQRGVGILRAAREDIEGGYLTSVEALVSAEVFSDFLDMARHLHQAGYKDPAAMLTGAVLEDGLRRVATANGVKVKQGDDISSLAQKCADVSVFNRLVQKRIQVWKDIRNSADHAEFDKYTGDDVADMIAGVESLADHLA